MSRRTWINLVFFAAVFVGLLTWAAQSIVTIDAIEQPYDIAGDFEAAAGIQANAEVSYLGVRYGRVDDVDRTPEGVRIDMKIERGKRIPEGSTANIFRKSAIGEPYVLFVPPEGYEGGGPFLDEGAVVPRERTSTPLEFSEMLRSASRLIGAIPPESARSLVHELATGLSGRSESLRELALAGDQLAGTFAERTDALDRLAANNTRLTRVVADHRQSLGRSVADLRALASSLRAADGDLLRLLDDGPELLGRTADVVANVKPELDCILKDLEGVIDISTTPERLAGLTTLLTVGPQAFEGFWDTRDIEADGVWVRVGLVVNPTNPAVQFVPPKEVPDVRTPAACGSGLVATTGDFTPIRTGGGVRSLPATGGPALAVAGLVLVVAAAVLRVSGVRTGR